MIEERKKKLKKELSYLLESEIQKEIMLNENNLLNENIKIKDIANSIYTKRGIDYKKIKSNNLIDVINETADVFKNKDKKTKRNMYINIIYIILLLILMKIPFDFVRDLGYDYLKVLLTKTIYYNLWYILFLLLYTVTMVCTFIVLLRNFNSKFNSVK